MNPNLPQTIPKVVIKGKINFIDDDEDSLIDQPKYNPYDDSDNIMDQDDLSTSIPPQKNKVAKRNWEHRYALV
jgi:hypothetical protein